MGITFRWMSPTPKLKPLSFPLAVPADEQPLFDNFELNQEMLEESKKGLFLMTFHNFKVHSEKPLIDSYNQKHKALVERLRLARRTRTENYKNARLVKVRPFADFRASPGGKVAISWSPKSQS